MRRWQAGVHQRRSADKLQRIEVTLQFGHPGRPPPALHRAGQFGLGIQCGEIATCKGLAKLPNALCQSRVFDHLRSGGTIRCR